MLAPINYINRYNLVLVNLKMNVKINKYLKTNKNHVINLINISNKYININLKLIIILFECLYNH